MFFFGFDCFSTWIMVGCSKDLGFEEFSISYNFRIDQNLFLSFLNEKISKECVLLLYRQDCDISYEFLFHTLFEYQIDPYKVFYWLYCLWHLILVKYSVWWGNKSVVLRKRLKIDLCKKMIFTKRVYPMGYVHEKWFSQN